MMGQQPKSAQQTEDDKTAAIDESKERTGEQRAATARRLNPHARGSQINLHKQDKPEAMTPLEKKEQKKSKPTKWQFGIRSRNSPSEAMLAIFKALKSMGAVWEHPTIRKPGRDGSGSPNPEDANRERERRARERQGSQSPEYSDSDPDAGTDPDYATKEERAKRRRANGVASASSSDGEGPDPSRRRDRRRRPRGRDRFGPWNDWGYSLPEDPWVINARFRKGGMFPPGVAHPSSTHSSRVDLSEVGLRRRSSTVGSQVSLNPNSASATPPMMAGSAHGSVENMAAAGPGSAEQGRLRRHQAPPDESCWVYVTIQLYCIERDSFMVDFKCAGYERLVRKLRGRVQRHISGDSFKDDPMEMQQGSRRGSAVTSDEADDSDDEDMDEGYMGTGRFTDEKDISSPFPFMDVASSLIVSLAQRE